MSRSWVEKFAVFAMALGLVALAAVSVAALLIAAGVFICLAAILYIINPAGVRAALKVLADKPDEWLKRAHDWLESFKEILATFQAAAHQAAASALQAESDKSGGEMPQQAAPQEKAPTPSKPKQD